MEFLKTPAARPEENAKAVSALVSDILEAIQRDGLPAVKRFAVEYDGSKLDDFRVPDGEIEQAGSLIPDSLKESLHFACDQVRRFAELQRATLHDLDVETEPGVFLGHRHVPVDSVGAYVPGGRYSLIASAIMSVVSAKVAGVRSVCVATPPRDGVIHPGLLYAARIAGADAVVALGGVQALGALAVTQAGGEHRHGARLVAML